MTEHPPIDRLDRLLLSCEDAVLEMSDREALAEAGDLGEVATLIARAATNAVGCEGRSLPVRRGRRRSRMMRGAGRRGAAPAKQAARTPILPERVRLAFMSGDIDDSEVALLLQEILSGPNDQRDD
jgi:hypothetical protein